jgi:hypothetical protein
MCMWSVVVADAAMRNGACRLSETLTSLSLTFVHSQRIAVNSSIHQFLHRVQDSNRIPIDLGVRAARINFGMQPGWSGGGVRIRGALCDNLAQFCVGPD